MSDIPTADWTRIHDVADGFRGQEMAFPTGFSWED
jgi:hypothetical protein